MKCLEIARLQDFASNTEGLLGALSGPQTPCRIERTPLWKYLPKGLVYQTITPEGFMKIDGAFSQISSGQNHFWFSFLTKTYLVNEEYFLINLQDLPFFYSYIF